MKTCGIVGRGNVSQAHFQKKLELLADKGVEEFVVSMDKDVGLTAAKTVLALKKHRPDLRLTCLLLWEEQAADWPEMVREQWFDTIAACDQEVMLEHHRTSDNLHKQVVFLSEHCDVLLLVLENPSDPDWNLSQQAQAAGLTVWKLENPAHD